MKVSDLVLSIILVLIFICLGLGVLTLLVHWAIGVIGFSILIISLLIVRGANKYDRDEAEGEDWWDNIKWEIRHTKGNIRAYFEGLSRWFAYRKVLMTAYDFDYASILDVERFQITRVRDCLSKYSNHVNWERDVQQMDLALKLLDIIEEDGCSERVGKPLTFEKIEGSDLSRLVEDPDEYWTLPVYVNTRNSKRFWPNFDPQRFEDPRSGNLWKDHLRVEKAWYLYHRLKMQYMRGWWD